MNSGLGLWKPACVAILRDYGVASQYRNGLSVMATVGSVWRELPGEGWEHGGGSAREGFMEEEAHISCSMQGSQDFSRRSWEKFKQE